MKSAYWKKKILSEIYLCYAEGEWGGQDPKGTFKKLDSYYSEYHKAKKKEKK